VRLQDAKGEKEEDVEEEEKRKRKMKRLTMMVKRTAARSHHMKMTTRNRCYPEMKSWI